MLSIKSGCRVLVIGLLLVVVSIQVSRAGIIREDFNSDVVGSGEWAASDPSVYVDLDNGWLHIDASGSEAYSDFAFKDMELILPIIVEVRMRLIDGGHDYLLPSLELVYGPDDTAFRQITYRRDTSQSGDRGWVLASSWIKSQLMEPEAGGEWITLRTIIWDNSASLYAKADEDTSFTGVAGLWETPIPAVKVTQIRLRQPWDAVCDIDYIAITQCCGMKTGGFTGNADCDNEGKFNLKDITKLIDHIYLSRAPLCCPGVGNTDGSADGKVGLADITRLIDRVYLSHTETAPCQ